MTTPPRPPKRSLLHHAIAMELRRRARGESHQALGDAMGVSPSSVGAWLRGDRQLYLVRFVELCRAIGVSPDVVLEAARRRVREHLGEDVA